MYARTRIDFVMLIVGYAARFVGLTTKDTSRGEAMLRLATDGSDVSQLLELTGVTGYAIWDNAFSA